MHVIRTLGITILKHDDFKLAQFLTTNLILPCFNLNKITKRLSAIRKCYASLVLTKFRVVLNSGSKLIFKLQSSRFSNVVQTS